MDIKVSMQAGVNSASGWTRTKAAPARKAEGARQAENDSAKKAGGQTAPPAQGKAVFAVDGDNKVVVQVLDANGKVIEQFPPEQFGSIAKELKAIMKNLFSREA